MFQVQSPGPNLSHGFYIKTTTSSAQRGDTYHSPGLALGCGMYMGRLCKTFSRTTRIHFKKKNPDIEIFNKFEMSIFQ
jgi:hypothetical protein